MKSSNFLHGMSSVVHAPLSAALWASRKGWMKKKSFPGYLLGVGNLTMGGSGKTPCVAWLAHHFVMARKKTAIVSRGYRRKDTGLTVVKPHDGVERVGDEPLWLAHMVPAASVIVGDKMEGLEYAVHREAAETIIMDDGFQRRWQIQFNAHVVLVRELDTLLEGQRYPRGWVREAWAQLRDATIIGLHAEAMSVAGLEALDRVAPRVPVFTWRLAPVAWYEFSGGSQNLLEARRRAMPLESVRGKRVFAMAGIANPERFLRTLNGIGAEVVGHHMVSDHHWYSARELEQVVEQASAAGARWVVTTEKDAVRLMGWVRPMKVPLAAMAVSFMVESGGSVLNSVLGLAQKNQE